MPTKKLIQAAGTSVDAIINSFSNLSKRKVFYIFYRHKLLIFLFLLTIYIIYKEEDKIPIILYTLFTAAIFALLAVRDYDRVTFALVILWSILILLKLLEDRRIILSRFFLLIIIFILIIEWPRDLILNNSNNKLRNEFIHLMNKHPMKYEVSTEFPRTWDFIGNVFIQHHLFSESQWISYDHDHLLFSAWTARHPYFYKSLDISYKSEKRKYTNFYEFLIDEGTAIIGSKLSNPTTNRAILNMYDKKYPSKRKCHHIIKVLDESEHFSITQVINKCEI